METVQRLERSAHNLPHRVPPVRAARSMQCNRALFAAARAPRDARAAAAVSAALQTALRRKRSSPDESDDANDAALMLASLASHFRETAAP
jgi:hypothetical protein